MKFTAVSIYDYSSMPFVILLLILFRYEKFTFNSSYIQNVILIDLKLKLLFFETIIMIFNFVW